MRNDEAAKRLAAEILSRTRLKSRGNEGEDTQVNIHPSDREIQIESLKDEARNIHEEARMVLPGIQALFGFQLIAVFNRPFFDLDPFDRVLHLSSLVLVAVSIGLIMAPAADHRLAERGRISSRWVKLASRYIASAMATLMIAVSVDIYIVATMIVESPIIGAALGALAGCFLGWLWFALPLIRKSRQRGAY
ncbi:MAG: hypothetical protein E6H67_02525 [Betaproteobacteria bacterium]|nr:MAG: hypothetical protein E6H74_03145 [Betaproteobacteria bacterium]TMH07882.1 MAG: hypothetical protein E6H67_02525 [Betaproteobacteria bacterium]